MSSLFGVALGICGLTHAQAAEFFGKGAKTIGHYTSGARPVPDEMWRMLAALYAQIIQVSEDALDTFDLEEVSTEGIQALARHQMGEGLPEPALHAALAMFILARLAPES